MGSPVGIKLCQARPGPLGAKSAAEGNRHSPPFLGVLGIPAMELTGVLGYKGHRATSEHSMSADWPTGYTVSQQVPG